MNSLIHYKQTLPKTVKTCQMNIRNGLKARILVLFTEFKVIQFFILCGALLYSLIPIFTTPS